MRQNMGGLDRIVRVVLGIVGIAAGIYFKTWWGAIGVALLLTAGVGFCPAYLPFGLSTRSTKPEART